MPYSTQRLPSLLKRFIQKQRFLQELNKRVTIHSSDSFKNPDSGTKQLSNWINHSSHPLKNTDSSIIVSNSFIGETNALTMLRLKYTLFSITWSNIAVVIFCSVDTSLFSWNNRWWLCVQIELVSANRRSRTLWLILSCLLNATWNGSVQRDLGQTSALICWTEGDCILPRFRCSVAKQETAKPGAA